MMIYSFLSTVFVALFVASTTPMATAGGTLFFEMDKYNITVTGNQKVPKYTFTSADYPGTAYKIMFQKIYETDKDGKKVGSTISLPSLDWVFEEDEVEESVFWIRNEDFTAEPARAQETPWTKLEFKNILLADKVKFDVILDGYVWSAVETTALNFEWKFSEGGDDEDVDLDAPSVEPDAADPAEPTQLCFGQGIMCFDIADKANVTAGDGSVSEIDVDLTSNGGEGITVTYQRFNGDLYHDPSFSYAAEEEQESGDGGILGAILSFFQMFIPCL